MKHGNGRKLLSVILAVMMLVSLLPTTAFAAEQANSAESSVYNSVDETGNVAESTNEGSNGAVVNESEDGESTAITTSEQLIAAIAAAKDGDTITLGEGNFTTHGNTSPKKSLTFVGAGAGTVWTIGGLTKHTSGEANGDYSFDGCDTITFEKMTLKTDNDDYRGFIRISNTVVKDCVLDGKTAFWGYKTAKFVSSTFNAPTDDYALWDYSTKAMSFDGCTFNINGKGVNVYVEQTSDGARTVELKDCTIVSTKTESTDNKAFLNIKNNNQAFDVTLTGDNNVVAGAGGEVALVAGQNGSNLYQVKSTEVTETSGKPLTVKVEKNGELKTVYEVKAPAAETAVDLNTFLTELKKSNYTFNGLQEDGTKLLVKWNPADGCLGNNCTQEHEGIDHNSVTTNRNVPNKVNGGNAQFYIANNGEQSTDVAVSISNVKFVYEPAAFQLYGNTNNKGSWTADAVRNGQLYFMGTGAVKIENCEFDHVVLTSFCNDNASTTIKNCKFENVYNSYAIKDLVGNQGVEVSGCSFTNCGAGIMVGHDNTKTDTVSKVTITNNTFENVDVRGEWTLAGKEGTRGLIQLAKGGDYKDTTFSFTGNTASNCGPVLRQLNESAITKVEEQKTELSKLGTLYTDDSKKPTPTGDGTEANPYTLEQLGAMTRPEYIAAQNRLNGIMYVTVGDYAYDINGVLGNGVRDDTTGQIPDHSKLNAYGENGYLGEKNDGANGKSVVFVGGSITSGVTGYTSIDKIGTSLLLALPAYTNVTFEGVTFKNVMSFNYQLYTSPWSQLGELKFDNCTFNGIIVGAIAARTLTFNGCEFKNYTNTIYPNSSNPTWIRPAYGNWTQGDNEGQGSDFRSLTTINFTDNKVTSTRPVKFEYISQWDITSTVTATGNSFDISKQAGDDTVKNVGLYLGAHTDANAFNLVAENNTKSKNTAALYTIPEGETSLPLGSTVKNSAGEQIELTDALKWKAGDATADKIVLKTVEAVASVGGKQYSSLQAAINAANTNDTITLLADATEDVVINKDITLDLGGKTLTNTDAGKATISVTGGKVMVKGGSVVGGTKYYNIEVTKGSNANLTLMDVTATAGNNDSSMIDNWGTLTIESGTYEGGLNVVKSEEGSTLTINGGKFTLNYATNGYTAVILVYGDTTITGGEFIQSLTTTGRWNHPQVVATGVEEGYTAITRVTGGHFVNKMSGESIFRGIGKGTSDNFEVSGGTFNKSVPDSYFKTGYFAKKTADGYTADGPYAVRLGTAAGYATLEEAFAAAKSGDTITLLRDCESDRINLETKSITVDLNGKVLTSTAAYGVMFCAKNGHKITVKGDTPGSKLVGTLMVTAETDGRIEIDGGTYESAQYCPIYINGAVSSENSKLTVKNATITALSGDSNQDNGVAVYLAGYSTSTFTKTTITAPVTGLEIRAGKLTLTNCTVTGGSGEVVTNANGNGTTVTNAAVAISQHTTKKNIDVTITGGTYTATAAVYQTNVQGTGSEGVKASIKSGTFNGAVSAETDNTVAVSGGTFSSAVPENCCAPGYIPTKNEDSTYGVKPGAYVAETNGVKYESLQEAINAAARKATVKLLADTRENVTISTPYLTLDLNGFTLNGSTGERKPALTVTARVTVKDSSDPSTGTIMREDTAENSGKTSHYVIDVQGSGWLTFESGTVKNGSGAGGTKGASLVRVGDDSVAQYPGLNIKGGTFTQDNFIVIKVDRGDLFLNGGTLNSANSYAVENWLRATIKGGTVNGAVSSWTYSGGFNSTLEISGGTVNGGVTSVNYGNADKVAKVEITGGTVTGELDTRSYDPTTGNLTSITDVAKSTIKVTGGTFDKDPSKYVTEDAKTEKNGDGSFGVSKVYLCKIGDTGYYTMDEAFKAQTASGADIVMLRDYTTGSTFNSGTVARVVDLNEHTWTYTGTDANSAAFEINYANASLTVKNGKIVSSQLVGLIPSASGGTIKYDNSSLTFENVEMSTTATSGIETNGNNTNDTVTLKNSTLNVPNGFGIYFPSSGKLTIDNSTINAKTMGVQVCAGSLSINEGSKITVTGDPVEKTENDGAIQDGAAISIVNRGYKPFGEIAITGGTFESKVAAIKAYDWDNTNKSEKTFTANDKVAVSGGTFSSAVPAGLCATGYVPTERAADGTYTVAVKEGVVAVIGKTGYTTLNEALMSAQTGETVVLMKDTTADIVMIRAGVTLNLYGHSVTNALLIYDNGQIIDTGDVKGIVQAEGYFMTTNEHTPVYDSTKNGYSFFDLRVGGGTKGNNAYLWLEGSEPDFSSAVALMKADTNGRRIKAVITFIWTDTVSHSEATQSYEFVDEYMSTYLENAASKSFFARVSGLDKFEGTVKAQAKFVITNESGVMLNELVGPEWTVKD